LKLVVERPDGTKIWDTPGGRYSEEFKVDGSIRLTRLE